MTRGGFWQGQSIGFKILQDEEKDALEAGLTIFDEWNGTQSVYDWTFLFYHDFLFFNSCLL